VFGSNSTSLSHQALSVAFFTVRQMSSELAQWTLGKLASSAIPPDLTERKKIVRLGLPRIIRLKENVPEFDYSSFYVTTGTENTGCLVAQDLALLIKVRTLIHEAFRASLPLPLLNS
jgi:hypothetical protein